MSWGLGEGCASLPAQERPGVWAPGTTPTWTARHNLEVTGSRALVQPVLVSLSGGGLQKYQMLRQKGARLPGKLGN